MSEGPTQPDVPGACMPGEASPVEPENSQAVLWTLLDEWCAEPTGPELPGVVDQESAHSDAATETAALQAAGQAFRQHRSSTSSPGMPSGLFPAQPAGLPATGLHTHKATAAAKPATQRRRPGRPRRPSLAVYQVRQACCHADSTCCECSHLLVCLQQEQQKKHIQQLAERVAELEAELKHAVMTSPLPLGPAGAGNPWSRVSWVRRLPSLWMQPDALAVCNRRCMQPRAPVRAWPVRLHVTADQRRLMCCAQAAGDAEQEWDGDWQTFSPHKSLARPVCLSMCISRVLSQPP